MPQLFGSFLPTIMDRDSGASQQDFAAHIKRGPLRLASDSITVLLDRSVSILCAFTERSPAPTELEGLPSGRVAAQVVNGILLGEHQKRWLLGLTLREPGNVGCRNSPRKIGHVDCTQVRPDDRGSHRLQVYYECRTITKCVATARVLDLSCASHDPSRSGPAK